MTYSGFVNKFAQHVYFLANLKYAAKAYVPWFYLHMSAVTFGTGMLLKLMCVRIFTISCLANMLFGLVQWPLDLLVKLPLDKQLHPRKCLPACPWPGHKRPDMAWDKT
jgi:hypothetical protein